MGAGMEGTVVRDVPGEENTDIGTLSVSWSGRRLVYFDASSV